MLYIKQGRFNFLPCDMYKMYLLCDVTLKHGMIPVSCVCHTMQAQKSARTNLCDELWGNAHCHFSKALTLSYVKSFSKYKPSTSCLYYTHPQLKIIVFVVLVVG